MTGLIQAIQRLPSKTRVVAMTILYGLSGGLAAVLFEIGINLFYGATFVALSKLSMAAFLGGSFAVIVITSLIAGLLLSHFCPEAAGSGIPQMKLAFWKDFGFVPFRVVWVKFVAGILTVGGGASLGREGPTVQLAGGLTSTLAGRLGIGKNGRRQAAAAGSAAGLAAAFNAPLAAVTFVLEEIIEDLNSRILGSVILASLLGALVVHAVIGRHPAFDLPLIDAPTWAGYALTVPAAAFASLIGVFFQVSALGVRRSFRQTQLHRIPAWLRPTLGGIITWAAGSIVFFHSRHLGVFSLGYDDLTQALNDSLAWRLAAMLLAAKFIATIAGYGSGGCGGIFAPNLFLGAMCGATLSGISRQFGLVLTRNDHILLTVVAMSACLGAVVRAPLTSILIVFEMTHEFALVPGLLVGGLISQAISRRLLQHSFYEQILVDDGHSLKKVMPPRDLRSWQEYPISAIANFNPTFAREDDSEQLQKIFETASFDRLPIVDEQGRPQGVVIRTEWLSVAPKRKWPPIHTVPICHREATIRNAQQLLIDSEVGMILIAEEAEGKLIGMLTLHDLLRAQEATAQVSDI
jgi:CIC family chloride channel protein